jgi:hypothetical protein
MLEHQASRKGGCAVEVHRTVRPGLLESVYAKCRALEPGHAGIRIEARTAVPVIYKGVTIPLGFRLKTPSFSKSRPSPRFSPPMNPSFSPTFRRNHLRIGLLMNFRAPRLKNGRRRFFV